MIRVVRQEGNEFACICPLHNDKNASLFVNLEKNAAFCFAGCYRGNVVDLVATVERLPKALAWRRIQNKEIFDFDNSNNEIHQSLENTRISDNTSSGIKWISADRNDYLLNRGFLRGTIKFWNIEYSETIKHIRIPVYTKEGILYCYSYRTVENLQPKYLHPGFKKNTGIVFAIDKLDEKPEIINLVEGQLDCIWLWQNGFPNTLAFLGMPAEAQIKTVISLGDKFRLCFDNDDAGRNYTVEIVKRLRKAGKKYVVTNIPYGKKDMQELSQREISKIFKEEKECQ